MIEKLKLFFLFLSISLVANADNLIKGHVKDDLNEPLMGANIYWEGTGEGTTTDMDGNFEIKRNKKHHNLVISFIGFETQTIAVDKITEPIEITLASSIALDEVTVSGRKLGTITARNSIVQSQKITFDELCRAACCSLAESFETNPSVDVSYADAATGARQIKLLGLSGTYVQMLTENYPNFRGAASLYGLDYVPGAWMESIQVSKGTSSVKNGYEALAGQINVEFKKPTMDDLFSVNLFASSEGRYEANADASWRVTDKLSTALLLHYSSDTKEHDNNKDGFMDMPYKKQMNFMNRWYYNNGKYQAQYGVRYLNEDRTGGQSKHHDFEDPYRIKLKTNRAEAFTKQAFVFNQETAESIALIASGSYHEQKSKYDLTPYNVYQNNLYASLMYENNIAGKHGISTGVSLNYDKFNENLALNGVRQLFNRSESVIGAYAQYTYTVNDKLTLLAGLRGDYSSIYKFFVTPRIHIKYDPFDWWHIRASAGKGFRSANVLAENNYLLSSSRVINIADNLNQEEAWNTGLNFSFFIPISNKELQVNAEWYYTNFLNQVVVDLDSDAHAVSFYNLNGRSYSNSFQIEATYPFFRGFTLTAAYRLTDAKTDYVNAAGEKKRLKKPLMSDYKGLLTASYQTPLKKWQFDITAQFNGGGRMPTPDAEMPLWDTTFKGYTVLNAQITRYFRRWSVYVGGENLTNFRQKNSIIDFENPRGPYFDGTMIWGPVHGAKYYIGMRFNLSRD